MAMNNTLNFEVAYRQDDKVERRLVIMLLDGHILVQNELGVTLKIALPKATEEKVMNLVGTAYGTQKYHTEQDSHFYISVLFQTGGSVIGYAIYGWRLSARTTEMDQAFEFLAKLETILELAKGTLTIPAQNIFKEPKIAATSSGDWTHANCATKRNKS